jgi:uncharacterized protein YciI
LRYHVAMRQLCLLAAVAAAGLLGQQAWPPPGLRCPQRTLVLFEPAENHEAQPLFGEHIAWITSQMRAGKVISGGPMSDRKSAAMLFASTDWAEIENLLKDEPFVHAGAIKVKSHDVWVACEVDPGATTSAK